MAKRKRRGVSPILVLLLTVLAAGLAAGWNYVAAIKTKYEGDHPFWSKQEYLKLSEDSLEYKVAQRVLKAETLERFAAVSETNGSYGTALAEQTGAEETAATEKTPNPGETGLPESKMRELERIRDLLLKHAQSIDQATEEPTDTADS